MRKQSLRTEKRMLHCCDTIPTYYKYAKREHMHFYYQLKCTYLYKKYVDIELCRK